MHRSGTSALTRVLSLLGCDLPKTLMSANPTNEAGHWESDAVYRLNDRILESAGSVWHDWLELNPGWFASPKAEEFRDEAVATLEAEFGSSRLFVLKDPRTCRLFLFWRDVLEQAGVRPLVIAPVRNPLEVAASLSKRDGFEPSLGHLLWLRHVLDAEAASRGVPRFFTSYERMLNGWRRVAEEGQSALGVSWPRLSERTAGEVEAFLSDRHRHHSETRESVVDNPGLSGWLRDSFSIFVDWAQSGEKPEDRARLDRIRSEFNAAAPAFGRLVAAGRQAASRARSLERSVDETKAKLTQTETAASERQQKVQQLEQELVATRERLTAGGQKVAVLEADVQKRAAETQAAQKAHAEAQARIAQAEAAASERQQKVQQLEQELAAARERLAEGERTIAALQAAADRQAGEAQAAAKAQAELAAKLAQTEAAASEREKQAQQLGQELAVARERLEEGDEKAAALQADYEAQSEAAAEAKYELDALRDQLAETRSALAQRRHEAEETAAELVAARKELERSTLASAENEKAISSLKEHVTLLLADRKGLSERLEAWSVELRQVRAEGEAQQKEKLNELAAARRQLEETRSALAQRRHEAEEAAAELAAVRKELKRSTLASAENEKAISGLKEHVTLLLADTDGLSEQLEARSVELRQVRAEGEAQQKEKLNELTTLTRLLMMKESECARQAEAAVARGVEADALARVATRIEAAASAEIGRIVLAMIEPRAPWSLLPAGYRLKRQMALVRKSGLFDAAWYAGRYEDVLKTGMDPLQHYIQFGAKQGRLPNGTLAGPDSQAESIEANKN